MDGLIVNEPYATELVTGKKDIEYRSTKLPKNKIGKKILILNGKFAIGYVVFAGEYHNLKDNQYYWHVQEHKMFSPFLKYKHKNGCIIWINDVDVQE